VNRHRIDADKNPNLHVDANPDPGWHQNDAVMPIVMRILPEVLHMLKN
jgi:hypothetical protein